MVDASVAERRFLGIKLCKLFFGETGNNHFLF